MRGELCQQFSVRGELCQQPSIGWVNSDRRFFSSRPPTSEERTSVARLVLPKPYSTMVGAGRVGRRPSHMRVNGVQWAESGA